MALHLISIYRFQLNLGTHEHPTKIAEKVTGQAPSAQLTPELHHSKDVDMMKSYKIKYDNLGPDSFCNGTPILHTTGTITFAMGLPFCPELITF